MDKTINWNKMSSDGEYRSDIIRVILATQAGRNYLSKLAEDAESMDWGERLKLKRQLGIQAQEEELKNEREKNVSGVGAVRRRRRRRRLQPCPAAQVGLAAAGTALKGLANILRTHTMRPLAWVKGAVTPNLKSAWAWISGGGVGRPALVAAGAFFATDYVASKFQGNKPEIEKLYAAGRNVIGSTVGTASTLIKLIPLALVAWGVYSFIKVPRHQKAN